MEKDLIERPVEIDPKELEQKKSELKEMIKNEINTYIKNEYYYPGSIITGNLLFSISDKSIKKFKKLKIQSINLKKKYTLKTTLNDPKCSFEKLNIIFEKKFSDEEESHDDKENIFIYRHPYETEIYKECISNFCNKEITSKFSLISNISCSFEDKQIIEIFNLKNEKIDQYEKKLTRKFNFKFEKELEISRFDYKFNNPDDKEAKLDFTYKEKIFSLICPFFKTVNSDFQLKIIKPGVHHANDIFKVEVSYNNPKNISKKFPKILYFEIALVISSKDEKYKDDFIWKTLSCLNFMIPRKKKYREKATFAVNIKLGLSSFQRCLLTQNKYIKTELKMKVNIKKFTKNTKIFARECKIIEKIQKKNREKFEKKCIFFDIGLDPKDICYEADDLLFLKDLHPFSTKDNKSTMDRSYDSFLPKERETYSIKELNRRGIPRMSAILNDKLNITPSKFSWKKQRKAVSYFQNARRQSPLNLSRLKKSFASKKMEESIADDVISVWDFSDKKKKQNESFG